MLPLCYSISIYLWFSPRARWPSINSKGDVIFKVQITNQKQCKKYYIWLFVHQKKTVKTTWFTYVLSAAVSGFGSCLLQVLRCLLVALLTRITIHCTARSKQAFWRKRKHWQYKVFLFFYFLAPTTMPFSKSLKSTFHCHVMCWYLQTFAVTTVKQLHLIWPVSVNLTAWLSYRRLNDMYCIYTV